MKLTVCIGSSCHLKGSRQVVETLQRLIAEHGLGDKVELGGTFCPVSYTHLQADRQRKIGITGGIRTTQLNPCALAARRRNADERAAV